MKKTKLPGTKADWLNPFAIAMVVYYFLMAIVGLLIPDNILKDIPWARALCDLVASVVPQIDRITDLGIKPDVNRFYFSILWAASPVFFVIGLLQIWNGKKLGYPIWSMPFHKALGIILVCLLIAVCSQWMYWMTDVTNRQLQLMLGNDLGRVLWGSVFYVNGAAYSFAGFLVVTLGWLTGYIPRNIKGKYNGR